MTFIRNLIYFCCPFPGYEWNAEQITRRWPVFTGRRLVAVAKGDGLVPFSEVRARFPCDAEFLAVENSRALGEFTAFKALLSGVASDNELATTFYAHAKGVSPKYSADPRRLVTVRRWAEAMYIRNLDDIAAVDRALVTRPVAGAFRRTGHFRSLHRKSAWHYSGAFFWFRNRALFSRAWHSALVPSRYCPEFYPSLLFDVSESTCLGPDRVGDLYNYACLQSITGDILP